MADPVPVRPAPRPLSALPAEAARPPAAPDLGARRRPGRPPVV